MGRGGYGRWWCRRTGIDVTAQALVEHCRTRIASYKKPRHVVFVDEIVKLPSGKIDKVRLRLLYGKKQKLIGGRMLELFSLKGKVAIRSPGPHGVWEKTRCR